MLAPCRRRRHESHITAPTTHPQFMPVSRSLLAPPMASGLAPTQPLLLECCSCRSWADAVAARGPYSSIEALIDAAREVWWHQTPVAGWLEAFAAHPKIGDIEGLRKKYGGTFGELSRGEQAAATGAPAAVLQDLADWNARYEARFGHIFIVCASGKSAEEMLSIIQRRYGNDPAAELTAAAVEQQKITELRLHRVFGGAGEAGPTPASATVASPAVARAGRLLAQLAPADAPPLRSPITTHVLDTCLGRPAPGVSVTLARLAPSSTTAWETVATGATNRDGRIPDLLPAADWVQPGRYRITFDVAEYQARCAAEQPAFFGPATSGGPARRFYPSVSVEFEIQPQQAREHFHVPLTWNPFGYSTYRGS